MTTQSGGVKLRNVLRSVWEWRKHPLTVLGIMLTLLALVLASLCFWAGARVADLGLNVAAELASAAITILVVDAIVQRREMESLKQQLIREMSSLDNAIALRAARELDAHGWLEDGTLRGARLSGANFREADLQGADLRQLELDRADLQGANLQGANLQEAYVVEAHMQGTRLWGARLRGAYLVGVKLQKARLWAADLKGADLRHANLMEADLLGANLQEADLRWAKLARANLQAADLLKADLKGTDLKGVLGLDDGQFVRTLGLQGSTMPDGSRYDGRFSLQSEIEDATEDGINTNMPAAMAEWYGVSLDEYQRGQVWAQEHRPIEQEANTFRCDVVIKRIEPVLVAAIRRVVPTYNDIEKLFRQIYAYLRQHRGRGHRIETHLAIYYDIEHPRRNLDVEAAVPVGTGVPASRQVTVRELPGVQTMAAVVHQGSYDDLGKVYTALKLWIETRGYRIAGPLRDVYVRGPGSGVNPASYVTEVQFPIEKA